MEIKVNGLASAMEVIAKEAKDAGITVEETKQMLVMLGKEGKRGNRVGNKLRKSLIALIEQIPKHPACAVFTKTSETYHTTTQCKESTGDFFRNEHKAFKFRGRKKRGMADVGYWMHIGERKALDFVHLLIKQKCFPIKWRETEKEITITYHFKSPVVSMASPLEVAK